MVYAAWVNLLGVPFIEVQPMGGARVTVPASGAAQLQTRLGLSGRAGGGMYLGYVTGTNQFQGSPALWRVGAPAALVLGGQRGAQNVGVAPAPGGRLWMFWTRNGRVRATRTNATATRFGAVVSPRPPAGATTLYRVTGEGSRGPLDALALYDGSSALGYWHQRIRPGLTLRPPPTSVAAGKHATFTVTDAGDPVKGAKVRVKFGGKVSEGSTAANGMVKLAVPPATRPGRYRAVGTRSGYARATARLRVR